MESIVQAKRVLEIFKEMSQIPRESGKRKRHQRLYRKLR